MKIADVMTQDLIVIGPTDSIQKAALLMKEKDVGSLPVCDGERLLGMVTDRDLVVRALCNENELSGIQIKEVMSSPIVYCFDDQDAEEAARIMEVKKIRRLVVLDHNKKLVGILSLDNLAESQALAGEVMANITHSIHKEAA